MASKSTTDEKTRPGSRRTSRRDDFTQAAIQIMFKRAGGKCCRCYAPTFGPVTNNPNRYRNIGQAAHIAAAASGGPRYDPRMRTEDRTSAANGLWLCSNCHVQVDRDVEEFTIRVLKEMKKTAEDRARREIGVATSVYPPTYLESSTVHGGLVPSTDRSHPIAPV